MTSVVTRGLLLLVLAVGGGVLATYLADRIADDDCRFNQYVTAGHEVKEHPELKEEFRQMYEDKRFTNSEYLQLMDHVERLDKDRVVQEVLRDE